LEKLNKLVFALENGDLSLEELNELESVTRQLHERSIILRYKAFEKDVLGAAVATEEVNEEPEPIAVEPEVTPVIEEEEKEEEPAFDFAIFDEAEEVSQEIEEEPVQEVEEPEEEEEPVEEEEEEGEADIAEEGEEKPESDDEK